MHNENPLQLIVIYTIGYSVDISMVIFCNPISSFNIPGSFTDNQYDAVNPILFRYMFPFRCHDTNWSEKCIQCTVCCPADSHSMHGILICSVFPPFARDKFFSLPLLFCIPNICLTIGFDINKTIVVYTDIERSVPLRFFSIHVSAHLFSFLSNYRKMSIDI